MRQHPDMNATALAQEKVTRDPVVRWRFDELARAVFAR
jgi:hypothetical protein